MEIASIRPFFTHIFKTYALMEIQNKIFKFSRDLLLRKGFLNRVSVLEYMRVNHLSKMSRIMIRCSRYWVWSSSSCQRAIYSRLFKFSVYTLLLIFIFQKLWFKYWGVYWANTLCSCTKKTETSMMNSKLSAVILFELIQL